MREKFQTKAEVDTYIAGDTLECLECGKHFEFLPVHLKRTHGMEINDYRERWGIPAMTPLAGRTYRERQRRKLIDMQNAGTITYDHLPAATTKAAASDKPKIGVAKLEHSALISALRPGDSHKLPAGARRADGKDADVARAAQARRRASRVAVLPHQQQLEQIIEKLALARIPSPQQWICRNLEIHPDELGSWMLPDGVDGAIAPERFAIKYLWTFVNRLGVGSAPWTDDEDHWLRQNHANGLTLPELAAHLKRKPIAIRRRLTALGLYHPKKQSPERLSSRQPWTECEDLLLKKRYPFDDLDALARSMDRSPHSLRERASRFKLRRLKKIDRARLLEEHGALDQSQLQAAG